MRCFVLNHFACLVTFLLFLSFIPFAVVVSVVLLCIVVRSGIVDGSFHFEGWGEGDVEGSEKDLGYQMCKVDDGVVDVAADPRDPALFEPHLKTGVDREEEFGGEFFVEVLFGLEDWSLAFDHRLQGAKTLGADAELAKKDVICYGKHF